MEAELARAVEQAGRSATAGEQAEVRGALPRADEPRPDSPLGGLDRSPDLEALLEERDALVGVLEIVQARLVALEEVAEHAASLETELEAARERIPEIRSAADAASERAAELSEALQITRSERDAARAALEGRIGDVQALRARVSELEIALAGTGGPAEEKIWLGDVAGEILDISQAEASVTDEEEVGESGDESATPDENPPRMDAPEVPPAHGSVWS
jgi:DNA repair exonuclease SbcCD ATPase subunit